jgi:uroporphyrin-3 C-methyltransferase
MSTTQTESSPDRARAPRAARLAVVLSLVALAGTAAHWLAGSGQAASDRARADELAKTQRRLNALDGRIQREREDLDRLMQRIGAAGSAEDSLIGRIARLEDAVARLPGAERVRFLWLLEQAEYFMRIANAQENLAGDSAGALTALAVADEHLRDAADPRLTPVRRLVANEMAALRAVPRVDTEGLVLKLSALSGSIARLPKKQAAPGSFNAAPIPQTTGTSGTDRAVAALRGAFFSIVSVRRTDEPAATLLSEESEGLLARGLELELQLARLALLRGEAAVYRAALANVRRGLEQYFDVASADGAATLAVLDELSRAPLPDSLPDISASLTELLRIKERELRP